MNRFIPLVWLFPVLFLLTGCRSQEESEVVALDIPTVQAALDEIHPEAIDHHIRVLADDSLEGRAPGTRGRSDTTGSPERPRGVGSNTAARAPAAGPKSGASSG